MDGNQISGDACARCHHSLEIITVRFKLAGAEVISACPNCAPNRAMARTESRLTRNPDGALGEGYSKQAVGEQD